MYDLHSPIVGFDESGVNFDHISLTSKFILSFFCHHFWSGCLGAHSQTTSLSRSRLGEASFRRVGNMQTKLAKSS